MVKLHSPENEVQLALLKGLFEAEGIPVFVHNDHFGSLRTGLQIELFNKKTIMVHERYHAPALAILQDFLARQEESRPRQEREPGYSWPDKIRMVVEGLLFGWVMPGRRWRRGHDDRKK